MELVAATNNEHKLKEIRAIMPGQFGKILSLSDLGRKIDVVEDGTTFLENALKKAKEISEATGLPALADDTGLSVDALGGEPGVYSARYAGAHGDDAANNKKLLSKLEHEKNRNAHFETAVALYYPSGRFVTGTGRADGQILTAPRGERGFGYDALFLSDELDLTFGEATEEQKNAVSHRARALHDLLSKL